ncbi:MAG: lysyl-tRNA synthetase [Acidobacteria bacterium OLB17]|nr:MAG: lysyl-tRNA synthetase [Acidobacteria bacterium OLB17]MCZ2391739.1 lysine--tRNA ligase [Acidobacteriota bacterium]
MTLPSFDEILVPNDQTQAREEHLARFADLVGNAYPSKFDRSALSGREDTISNLKAHGPVAAASDVMAQVRATLEPGTRPPAEVKDKLNETLKELGTVRIAGRIATPIRGNFVHLTDGREKLQIYAKKGQFTLARNDGEADRDSDQAWEAWQILDHGDLIGVEGYLFVTNTGEVSVHVERLYFLAKALSPMPDKMHGIEDAEIKQRQRYLDLIASSLKVAGDDEGLSTRETFEVRAKTISSLRRFLEDNGYIEVETPMLTPKATGAAAKPFKTHHNALDIDLYARIAPELYLKRLLVGGFEKVYELNRNFRNEGISYKHNPEFTMLEFYCAYMDVNGMMDFCERMIQESVRRATGGLTVNYERHTIDFSAFRRLTMKEAIAETGRSEPMSDDGLVACFEEFVEPNLIQPTFITDFPKSISPLSKASPENPQVAERFELYINGMEVANGFSELNDPREQYERFVDQAEARERGDDEAMVLDEDYVRALSYGMPPAAGIGIGIDRLVMLLTNKHSIRDVILFPHMRPERRVEQAEQENE